MTTNEIVDQIHYEINEYLEENVNQFRDSMMNNSRLLIVGNGYAVETDKIDGLKEIGYRGDDPNFNPKPFWKDVPDRSFGMCILTELIDNIEINFKDRDFDLNSVSIRHLYFCKVEEENEIKYFQNNLPVYEDRKAERVVFSGILDILDMYELNNLPDNDSSDIWIIQFTELLSVFAFRIGNFYNLIAIIRSAKNGDSNQITFQ